MASPILTGGTNCLQLEPNGREYYPGDEVPVSGAQLRSLKKAGLRFSVPKADPPKDADKPKGKTD